MKQAYLEPKRMNTRNKLLLENITRIVEKYQSEGYKMTLRQLYYQLVATDILPNQQKEYAHLSRLLTEARMTGLVDWDFIEDRIRIPKMPSEFEGIPDLIEAAIASYRKERWIDQDNYVEVWVEKDALSGVLSPVTREYHVRLLVNRGYSSASAMHDAALRIRAATENGKTCTVIYLGDHDPSGEDMVRDIKDRLTTFGCDVTINKIALTMDQIRQYNPPPNPAKLSDPRSGNYIAEHGDQSWELDALPPNVLDQLLRDTLEEFIDRDAYDDIVEQEDKDKSALRRFANKFKNEDDD